MIFIKKYSKIKYLGDTENKGIFQVKDDEVVCEEKMDGCFRYDMKLKTNKGAKPIGKIVNNKMNLKVLSYNIKENKIEYKPIINWYKNGKTNNWYKVIYQTNRKERFLIVTNNHKFYDGEKMKPLKEFGVDDFLYINEPELNSIQKDLLIGSILGDGSFRYMNHDTKNPMFSETHGKKQKEYLKFKESILSNLISVFDSYKGRYDKEHRYTKKFRIRSYTYPTFKQLGFMYEGNQIQINKKIIENLNYKSLSIWYCDDGGGYQNKYQRARATFHTQSFSEKECSILIEALNNLGFKNLKIENYGKGNRIQFSADETEKLFNKIAKYIPKCMNYKLPYKYRNISKYNWNKKYINLSKAKIKDIKKCQDDKLPYKYDIEVKDNHNYFIKGVLVSNSNARFWLDNGEIKFGSRNVHDLDRENQQFKEFIDYILDNIDPEDLDPDLIYVGEYMTKHSLEYDWENIPTFIGFDVLHKDTGQPLDYKIAIDRFSKLGLEFAVMIFEGTVREWKEKDIDVSEVESIYRDGKPEGIVIKNYNRNNQYGRPLFAKIVNEDFQEKKKAKFGQSKIKKSNTPLVIEKYCTEARIEKIINKMTVEEGKDLSRSLMNGLYHRVINDFLQEHIVDMAHDKNIDQIDFNYVYKRVPKKCLHVLDEKIMENAG